MTDAIVGAVHADNVAIIQKLAGDVVFKMAETPASEYILEFDVVAERFVGRTAVFATLDSFVSQNACGYFELVADAGLGKTALAAEIARRKNAIAFYASVGYGTRRPEQFLAHVSAELLGRYALGPTSLPAGVGDSSAVLSRYLREAATKSAGVPVWIVVDGLDEADAAPAGANPLLLPLDLPTGVFVVVTRRTGSVVAGPGTPVRRYELRRDDPDQQEDVKALLWDRVRYDERIRRALSRPPHATAPDDLVAALAEASDGNFMYLSFVLADIIEGDGTRALDLTKLPRGLAGYYDQFWGRITALRDRDWPTWDALYRPVLERMAVAYEAVSADWLAVQVARPASEIHARVLEPWARVLSVTKQRDVTTWRLVHRTFSDYLGQDDRVDMAAAHAAVAESYVGGLWERFDEWDGYGLRHAAAHLASAASSATGAAQHTFVVELARLVVNEQFIQRQLIAQDPSSLERALVLAMRTAAADDSADATFPLVSVVLGLLRFRRQLLQPRVVFAAAHRGEVAIARKLLHLWGENLDPDWQTALTLMVAWLAAERAPQEALALRDEIRAGMESDFRPDDDMNARLLLRVSGVVDGHMPTMPPLPDPPEVRAAEQILHRLAGGGPRALRYSDPEELSSPVGEYYAGSDGLALVSLALRDPTAGQPLLRDYVAFHATYGYPQYRSNSLRSLLAAVLQHPDEAWVRDQLPGIGMALMAPAGGEFIESLELAVLARQGLCGDDDAVLELALRAEAEIETAGMMPPASPTAPAHGEVTETGDIWATHRRRLAALAEAAAPHQFTEARAGQLVDAAASIQGGFAGYCSPAYLTIAEAASIVAPTDSELIRDLLMRAIQAAHNIRDPLFALRMTARALAMEERWWPTPEPDELAVAVASLTTDPGAPALPARHIVGETLPLRQVDDQSDALGHAMTLREIAMVHQRPVSEFVRLNPELGADQDTPLARGTRVNLPDPHFAPMLAARLAGGLLAAANAPSRPGQAGTPAEHALIRRLVPVAAADPTALATTLARLILATPTDDRAMLDKLRVLSRGPSGPDPARPPAGWG